MKLFTGLIGISLLIWCNTGCSSCSRSGRYHRGLSANINNVLSQDAVKSNKNKTTAIPPDEEKCYKLKKGYVYVTKVIDGDTFWINDGSNDSKVRFIGIDAPETRNTGHKKKGYYGMEAKEYVTRLTENKWVRLELDVRKRDQYQRLLAYVYLEDGTFLNANLVANGYAIVDTYPPNVKFTNTFIHLQHIAQLNKEGLWAE